MRLPPDAVRRDAPAEDIAEKQAQPGKCDASMYIPTERQGNKSDEAYSLSFRRRRKPGTRTFYDMECTYHGGGPRYVPVEHEEQYKIKRLSSEYPIQI